MKPPGQTAFLERRAYRRRRVSDAARMLPVLGILLFLVPILWPGAEARGPGTGRGGLYLFGAWGLLIVAAALIARPLSRVEEDGPEAGRETGRDTGRDAEDPR